jgi:hypothetical protein
MGVIDVLFYRQCSQSFLLTKSNRLYILLSFFPLSPISTSFCPFLSTSFYRVQTTLLMGVAPEAIAEIFGYRLRKIDKTCSLYFFLILSTYFAFAMGFPPLHNTSPRVEDEVNLCFVTDISLFPAFFIFCSYLFP